MKNKKAEFNLQGMLISILMVGLFFSLFGSIVVLLGVSYDTLGYNSASVNAWSEHQDNLSSDINVIKSSVDATTVDSSWFDWLSGIFNKVLIPFKTTYRAVASLFTMIKVASSTFELLPSLKEFFITLVTILVFVGIVMIKFFMGKQK